MVRSVLELTPDYSWHNDFPDVRLGRKLCAIEGERPLMPFAVDRFGEPHPPDVAADGVNPRNVTLLIMWFVGLRRAAPPIALAPAGTSGANRNCSPSDLLF